MSKNSKIKNLAARIFETIGSKGSATCSACGKAGLSCCSTCARASAHLLYFNSSTSVLGSAPLEMLNELKQKYGWCRRKGFLGPEGCNLPHYLRSATCLGHVCGKLSIAIGRKKGYQINTIADRIEILRRKDAALI